MHQDSNPHHLRLLTLAGEAFDQAQAARQQVQRDGGAYYRDRFGQPKAHPALGVARDSMIAFARLIRELELDVEPPSHTIGRPPRR